LRPWEIFHAFHERRCRDCNTEIGTFACGLIRASASGEIQIDRYFPGEDDCEVGHHRTFAGGQNDRNSWIGKFLSKKTAQGGGRAKQFSAAQFGLIGAVNDRSAKAAAFQTAHAGFGKMSI